jgi:dethiobiotin synthetase/adenosylmethionine--8-amino-7-oxononanoate aminotransferase
MALRAFAVNSKLLDESSAREPEVITSQPEMYAIVQDGCYHGDTLGAMDVSPPNIYNRLQHPWYTARCLPIQVPTVAWRRGILDVDTSAVVTTLKLANAPGLDSQFRTRHRVYDVQARLKTPLAEHYKAYVSSLLDQHFTPMPPEGAVSKRKFAACVLLEPVLMGAGGMKFVDPLFQRILVDICRERGAQVVFDEVAVGMYRLGYASAGTLLGVQPDVAAYAKLLTGGYMPLAATLARERVFDAFKGATDWALLHGHSYTAHPVGCAAALEALHQLRRRYPANKHTDSMLSENDEHVEENLDHETTRDCWSDEEVLQLSKLPGVTSAMSLGTVLAIELDPKGMGGYDSHAAADVVKSLRNSGVFARPLGNVVYIMASAVTPKSTCHELWRTLTDAVSQSYYCRQ